MRSISLSIIGIFLLLAYTSAAQVRQYRTAHIDGEPPEIDGLVNEKVWDATEWEGDFTQRQPYDGQPATQKTAFKIVYDNEALYVAIRAFDTEPGKIEKRMTRRDDADGDKVAIQIDSYYDRLTAFGFTITAAGVKTDKVFTNDNNEDLTWDPVWYVKTSFDSLGWIAEMKIPYTQLRFGNQENYTWGLQVLRYIFREEELSGWQAIPVEASGWVSKFGDLIGISGIKPKKEVELIPYVMGNTERYKKEDGNPFATGTDYGYNAGLDGKIALTNDLTMNFTINPDFGQVEADPSVVNLTTLETYYQEKRPFFIEGNNIFSFRLTDGNNPLAQDNLFYSRRIGRIPHHYPDTQDGEFVDQPENTTILGAFKLSGKTSQGISVGVMECVAQEEQAVIDSEGNRRKETVEPMTNYFNARVQKDFNKGESIFGGMFTSTNRFIRDSSVSLLPTAANTGGLDFTRYWKDKTYFLTVAGAFSYISGSEEAITKLQRSPVHYYQRPDAKNISVDSSRTSLFGHGGNIEFGKTGEGHWQYVAWITWRSPGFDLNDMGYSRQGDIIQQVLWVGYRIWEPFSIFRSLNASFNQWTGWDFAGENVYQGLSLDATMQFKNYWTFSSGIGWDGQNLNRYNLRGGPAIRTPGGLNIWYNVGTDARKKLNFEAGGYNYVTNYNNDNMFDIYAGINYRPINALQLSIGPHYSKGYNMLQYIETLDYKGEERYIMGKIDQEMFSADIRINYNITPDMTIQFWGQPFIFAGDYSRYKRVTDTRADNYYDRFHEFTADEILFNPDNNYFSVDEDLDGITDYGFDNPDFTCFEFRSNLVFRWEYIPGSTLYAVWSQGRMDNDCEGQFNFRNDMDHLFSIYPNNVFLIKLSYRFSI